MSRGNLASFLCVTPESVEPCHLNRLFYEGSVAPYMYLPSSKYWPRKSIVGITFSPEGLLTIYFLVIRCFLVRSHWNLFLYFYCFPPLTIFCSTKDQENVLEFWRIQLFMPIMKSGVSGCLLWNMGNTHLGFTSGFTRTGRQIGERHSATTSCQTSILGSDLSSSCYPFGYQWRMVRFPIPKFQRKNTANRLSPVYRSRCHLSSYAQTASASTKIRCIAEKIQISGIYERKLPS